MADKLTAPLYSSDGKTKGDVTLETAVFGIEPNVPVMHQVVTAQLAAARAGTHNTKTRAEVRGGVHPARVAADGRATGGGQTRGQLAGDVGAARRRPGGAHNRHSPAAGPSDAPLGEQHRRRIVQQTQASRVPGARWDEHGDALRRQSLEHPAARSHLAAAPQHSIHRAGGEQAAVEQRRAHLRRSVLQHRPVVGVAQKPVVRQLGRDERAA